MISIVYFSKSGNTKSLAEIVASGARKIGNTEVNIFSIDDVDYDCLQKSDAVIIGSPTYYANTCWQLKKWFDELSSHNVNLEGKIGGVFVTAQHIQGGADIAALTLIQHMMVKGMLVYSGGCAVGKPYIHLAPVAINGNDDFNVLLCDTFGQRVAQKADDLFSK